MTNATYEWNIMVRRWDEYGGHVKSKTPAVIIAATKSEVTTKVHAMFEAKYDEFRDFWSHDWRLVSVREVTQEVDRVDQV